MHRSFGIASLNLRMTEGKKYRTKEQHWRNIELARHHGAIQSFAGCGIIVGIHYGIHQDCSLP